MAALPRKKGLPHFRVLPGATGCREYEAVLLNRAVISRRVENNDGFELARHEVRRHVARDAEHRAEVVACPCSNYISKTPCASVTAEPPNDSCPKTVA